MINNNLPKNFSFPQKQKSFIDLLARICDKFTIRRTWQFIDWLTCKFINRLTFQFNYLLTDLPVYRLTYHFIDWLTDLLALLWNDQLIHAGNE